jgi:dTDP-4-amino-4,6-dideoxygalactose transaminase
MIPFNKPYLHGRELVYIAQSVASGKISGDSLFTRKCHEFFEGRYNFRKVLLTTSCTDALEMAAILLDIQPGDEVIAPSYTFVSTVNAFVLRGAKIVFADSYANHPNIDPKEIEKLISKKTKAIVVVHYGGIACDMDSIMDISKRHGIPVVEDAAQAINATYKGKPLGGIGTFGTFSFHETKNIISGEGGMLAINDSKYIKRAEIIREKGTNRSSFFRGEVDKYGWVDIGSSFLPSDIIAAYLYAQLEQLDEIQARRLAIWHRYNETLNGKLKGNILLPSLPNESSNNAHIFYLICDNIDQRDQLIYHLKSHDIIAVFHYLSLHNSTYYKNIHGNRTLPNSDYFSERLVRLPLFYELTDKEVDKISECILQFLNNEK